MGSTRTQPRLGLVAGALLRTQPDERLVAMTRDGASAPFDEIVRRHRSALLAFAGTVAPPSSAEDVVQDSLLKAYAALQGGAEPDLLRAWLFRIVRNTAIDERRGVRHHEQLDENYDGVEQPPQALDRRERIAALTASIRDLPGGQREAIVKRELEGRGHAEIGRALQLSPGAVRQLIYRARHALREAAGAMIPAALLRAASLPGADQAAGGVGMAGAIKLGLAAVVASGTIVAGASIEGHQGAGTADAQRLSPSARGPSSAVAGDSGEGAGDASPRADRSGSSNSGRGGGDGRGERSGRSGGDGGGVSSGPDGGSVSSGSGSGDGGSGSSGSGSSGSGDGGSGTSGPGGGDAVTISSDGGGTSGGSGSGDLLDPLDGGTSGPG